MANGMAPRPTVQGFQRSRDSLSYTPTPPPSPVRSGRDLTPIRVPIGIQLISDNGLRNETETKNTSVVISTTAALTETEEPSFQFTHCNECETEDNPDYKGCNHPEDPEIFENQLENSIPASDKPTVHELDCHESPRWLLNLYDMIKSANLTNLFDENIDENCRGIFLCTMRGDLVGKAVSTDGTISKRASVLGALTWRYHSAKLTGTDPSKACRVHPLKTIKFERAAEANQYKSMVVELNGQAIALEVVKDSLLVGVQGFDVGEYAEEQNGAADTTEEEDGEEVVSGNGSLAASKMRALELKADGMAEYLRGELKEFVMPKNEVYREQT